MNKKNSKGKNMVDRSREIVAEASESTKGNHIELSRLAFPFALIISLTLLSGAVHGIIDGRWSTQVDLLQQGARLNEVPEICGDWEMVESKSLDEGEKEMLRCYGSDVRKYRHRLSGDSITVAVLFGPRGPIAVHTPEICYDSVGTKQDGARRIETVTAGDVKHQFWGVQFLDVASNEPSMDVWYAWSNGGPWVAAEHPRFWMVDTLYKIQIAGPIGNDSRRPCEEFLTVFTPFLEQLIE